MFNNETHVHHHHEVQGEKQTDDQSGQRVLVGLIGLVVALVTAFFVGKAVANQEDAQAENQDYEDLKSRWKVNKYVYDGNYQAIVDNIVERLDSLLKRQASDRVHKIALLVFAFIAGATAFAGALAASKVLMGAGLVIGACTGIAAFYRLGYSYFSTRNVKDAEAIDRSIVELFQLPPLVVYP